MPFQQVENPRNVFGSNERAQQAGVVQTRQVRNISSANPIRVGNAVIYSSLTTDGAGVLVTTVAGSPRFAGVALTSASTVSTSGLLATATPTSAWLTIAVEGRVMAHLDTAVVNGDIVGIVATTAAAGASNGGLLGVIAATNAAGAFFGVAGFAHTSGSTTDTAGTTRVPTGLVTLRPCLIPGSTL